ncbi:ribosomal protein S18-alanine N-acetyltransferase [Lacticaseibacillus pantheris]|jgi:ribosomal-protein-alanine N-acetyltransferase|uniref:ribosomal protein S18-alanine N-acetyltransferase n=2 Tax=Lacticaseibacillus pantheris TaxID=171523 RepID=UPI003B847DDE
MTIKGLIIMWKRFRVWIDQLNTAELAFSARTVTVATEQIILRQMTAADIGAALDIERDVYGDTPWDRFVFLSELQKVRSRLYVVAVNMAGRVVGFVGTSFRGAEAHITNLAVASDYQHHGLGKTLLEAMIGVARAHNDTRMTLEVRTDNTNAQQLYRSLGFRDGHIKRNYYASTHQDALDMRLELSPARAEMENGKA